MQPKTSNWNADSSVAHYAKYQDSVVVDYDLDKTGTYYKSVWVAKGEGYNGNQDLDVTHELQYLIVPSFFAIVIALLIFGFVVFKDNDSALKEKDSDSIMDLMRKNK